MENASDYWRDLGRRLDGIAGSIKLLAVALWEHSHEGSDDKLVMLPSDSHDKVANLAGMPKTIDRILGSICDGKSKCFNNKYFLIFSFVTNISVFLGAKYLIII